MNEFFHQQHLAQKQLETFGNSLALRQYRFDRDHGLVPQIEQARKYAANFDRMRQENLGLMFWGVPGNGKTFAAACIANALLEQEKPRAPTVRMTTFATIISKLPAMTAQDKEWYLDGFRNCDLLILDDFGMERQTDYAREQLFQLIDSRYLAGLPLIITTNLSFRELKAPADLTQQRIYDRILEMCVPVCFDGESLRQERARENLRRYRTLVGA